MPASTNIIDPAILLAISRVQKLADLFHQRREQLARDAGLTTQQWCVLEQITDEHFMPSMFARERESSPAAVSKIIRQLLDKGIIAVAVSDQDGRQRKYALTTTGQELMDRIRAIREMAIEAVWTGFPPEVLATFNEFSLDLISRLEAYSQKKGSD